MEQLLLRAHEQLVRWERSRERATRHLGSLANLIEQLDTLHSCKASKLGVLSQHSSALPSLEGKLVEAMERAVTAVTKEKQLMSECVCELTKCWREGEKVIYCYERQGLEVVCGRTSQSFSLMEQCGWLRALHAAYSADLEERVSSVRDVRYTSEGVAEVVRVWRREPPESSEMLKLLQFSVVVEEVYM